MMRDDILKRTMKAKKPDPSPAFSGAVRTALSRLPQKKKQTAWRYLPTSAVVFAAVAVVCIAIVNNKAISSLFQQGTPSATQQHSSSSLPSGSGPESEVPGALETTQDGTQTPKPLIQDTPSPIKDIAPIKLAIPEGMESIGTYKTMSYALYDKARLANIIFACQQLDGLMLSPGQKLSFFDLVLNNGTTFQTGLIPVLEQTKLQYTQGPVGITQVATTLLDAAMLAGLDVVERHPSELPCEFVAKGLEANVDLNGKMDLVISNSHDFPIWIKAKLDTEQRNIIITVYGKAWQGKRPIELISKCTSVQPAPPPVFIEDATIGKGEVMQSPSDSGYKITIIRRWSDPVTNETTDETMYNVEYKPFAGEIRYPPGEKPKGPFAQSTAKP